MKPQSIAWKTLRLLGMVVFGLLYALFCAIEFLADQTSDLITDMDRENERMVRRFARGYAEPEDM